MITEITRQKMRLARLKNPNRYWKGKKRIDMLGDKNPSKRYDVRKKISISLTGKHPTEQTREKFRKNTLGKKLSIQTRLKMSKSAKRGALNPLWRGGKTKKNRSIRESLEYELWRSSVILRDNFICQKYKTRGGKLQVHHILNFSNYPELRFAIDNGITLSTIAHKEFHKKYGTYNNTREQIDEFIKTN